MTHEFYWHIHHEHLIEELTEPIQNRIDYINTHKPIDEQETRLRLLHIVTDQSTASKALKEYNDIKSKALKEYDDIVSKAKSKALKEYDDIKSKAKSKTWREYDDIKSKALKEYHDIDDKAKSKASKEYHDIVSKAFKECFNALHDKECPNCPYDWEQNTIFPRREVK